LTSAGGAFGGISNAHDVDDAQGGRREEGIVLWTVSET
jgi:hypothetical protein